MRGKQIFGQLIHTVHTNSTSLAVVPQSGFGRRYSYAKSSIMISFVSSIIFPISSDRPECRQQILARKTYLLRALCLILTMATCTNALMTTGKAMSRIPVTSRRFSGTKLWMDMDDKRMESIDDFGEEDLQTAGAVIEDLNWRVDKLRLEEENKKRFLKAKPRFLPYDECRKWVQAFSRWNSKEDWLDWIRMGEKRNSYIPSRPDRYYGERGDWISWVSLR